MKKKKEETIACCHQVYLSNIIFIAKFFFIIVIIVVISLLSPLCCIYTFNLHIVPIFIKWDHIYTETHTSDLSIAGKGWNDFEVYPICTSVLCTGPHIHTQSNFMVISSFYIFFCFQVLCQVS